MKSNWKLNWDDSEDYVIFREIREDGAIIMEFSLDAPRYAKLYYALKDWFMD